MNRRHYLAVRVQGGLTTNLQERFLLRPEPSIKQSWNGAPSTNRSNYLNAAVTLFRRKGYAATGLNDILQQSHAPKGSLYHYFPRVKSS